MIDASNAVLCGAPEAFNRIRVTVARDVNGLSMVYALMAVTHARDWIVNPGFIRKDNGLRHDTIADMRRELGRGRWIGDDLSDDAATTLHHAKDCGFADTASSQFVALVEVFVLFESAEIAFVHLDFARQFWAVIFIEH